jgi:exodeoxyribonuclease VII large subunit
VPALPRAIGVVTSLGAAALHDVMTALQRRVPHIPVVLVAASVQGANAPQEMIQALQNLYQRTHTEHAESGVFPLDVILLVRGGGSLEDLWAFNDEALVRCVTQSPVPLISGVGHETDFTLVDFASDLRAPTPTAAAELAAVSRDSLLQAIDNMQSDLQTAVDRQLDRHAQGLDLLTRRLGRPSGAVAQQSLALSRLSQRLPHAVSTQLQQERTLCDRLEARLRHARDQAMHQTRHRLDAAGLGLKALDPSLVLQRGYAWVADELGQPVTGVGQIKLGQTVNARLADGQLNLSVLGIRRIPDKNS